MKAFESIDLIAQPGRAQTALRRIAHTVQVVLGRHMIDESEVRRTEGIANQLLQLVGERSAQLVAATAQYSTL